MKDQYPINDNQLPSLTEQDQEFAERISDEFNLPLDEVSWFVELIRGYVDDFLSSEQEVLPYFKTDKEKILNSSDFKMTELIIDSNYGQIKIAKSDPMFTYLENYLIRTREKLEQKISTINKQINTRKTKSSPPIIHILRFFNSQSMVSFQKYVAIGRFLVHFKLFSNKPLMTESEFIKNPTDAAQDYKHYLSDYVRSLIKRISPDNYRI